MWNGNYKLSEATAARRLIYLFLVANTDGLTPVTAGEAGGQAEISKNGGAFSSSGVGTLVAVGNGHYYVQLTAANLDTLGRIKVRYKSASTAEAFAEGDVVAYDPFDAAGLGLSRLDAAVTTRSSHTAADVWASATRTLSAFSFAVDISATGLAAIWNRLTSALTTSGSIGKLIVDNLDTPVSGVGGGGATPATIWDYLTASISTAGSIGKLLKDNVDNTISSRSSHSAADVWSVVTRSLTAGVNVTQLNGDSASAANLQRSAGAIMYGTVNTTGFSPTTTAFESAVTVEATADHFKGRVVLFLTGALAGQACSITAYSKPGSNGRFTVSVLTDVPANTDAFIIL